MRDIAPSLAAFHPAVRTWFTRRFGAPTEAQARGWPAIHSSSGRDTLIAAPTGSGKTLAAFLVGIDGLIRSSEEGTLEDRIGIVYVSPLKALGNDIQRNLEAPLAEIQATAKELGLTLPSIRTAVRSGDTPPSARQAIIRTPPHILITTPEVAVSDADGGEESRATAARAHGDRGRDPRAGARQARQSFGALAGTAGLRGGAAARARGPVRHAAPDRDDRRVLVRQRPNAP